MGQQLPNYLQNPQFLQGLAKALPQQGENIAGSLNPLQGGMPQIPGVDPAMMAQAQQQVANPNAGDALTIFPGPKELAIGAAGGVVTAAGLSALVGTNNFNGPLIGVAKWFDGLKPVKLVSNWMAKPYKHIQGKAWLKEGTHYTAATIDKGADWQQAASKSVAEMEKRHVRLVMGKFPNRFDDKLKGQYGNFLQNEKSKIIDAYNKHVEENFKNKINGLEVGSEEYAKALNGRNERILSAKNEFFNFAHKDAAWLGKESNLTFDRSLNQAKAQIHYLENVKEKLTPDEKKILERLRGFKERVNGLRGHYKGSYEAQAKLTAKLAADGVGPVGRTIAMGGQYLQRIFNGDTMSMGGGKGILNAGLLGPVLAGGIIFGQSIQKASKAEKGDKTKAFFHDFLGTGIANFVGWELGRKWLNSSGIMPKVLGKYATKRPFDNVIGRHLPIVGEKFGKIFGDPIVKTFGKNWFTKGVRGFLGTGLGGMFARLTLGGLATEIGAMFIFGTLFQKVGEGVSHLIFGKPKAESTEEKAKQAQKAQQKMAQGLSQTQQPQQLQQYPQAAQQAAAGRYNPALASSQPMRQASFNGQGATPPQGLNNPAGYPTNAMGRGYHQPAPQYSLSPEAISQSVSANQMQTFQNQIMSEQAVNQKKDNGRPNTFLSSNTSNNLQF